MAMVPSEKGRFRLIRTSPSSSNSRRCCDSGGRRTYLIRASFPRGSSPSATVAACSEKPPSADNSPASLRFDQAIAFNRNDRSASTGTSDRLRRNGQST